MAKLTREAVKVIAATRWPNDEMTLGDLNGPWVKTVDFAVEIAYHESGFDTRAVGGGAYGLWQVQMEPESMRDDRIKRYGLSPTNWKEELFNPVTNARVAHAIWKDAGESWEPWTTAQKAIASLRGEGREGGPQLADPLSDQIGIPNPLEAIQDLIGVLMSPEFWKRVGLGLLGAVVILLAVIMFTKVGSAATTVATKGAVK